MPKRNRKRKPVKKIVRKSKPRKTSKPSKLQLQAENQLLRDKIAKLSKKSKKKTPTMTREFAARVMQRTKERKANERIKTAAEKAGRVFRPRKTERDTIVFIGRDGKRLPIGKGRKGYAVYIGKRGGKKLLRDFKRGHRPQRITEINLPATKQTRKARQKFNETRKLITRGGSTVSKGEGIVKPKGQYDFSDKTVSKIARSLSKSFSYQKSQRNFLISANVLIRLEDGTDRVYTFSVPISKPDHLAIEAAGMENFVRQKFYAHLAKELAFDGYVTSGSANHVRRLKENMGKERAEWTKEGIPWEARHDTEQVQIKRIEWKIEQLT